MRDIKNKRPADAGGMGVPTSGTGQSMHGKPAGESGGRGAATAENGRTTARKKARMQSGRRQGGFSPLLLTVFLLLGLSLWGVSELLKRVYYTESETQRETVKVLREARQGLLNYAITPPPKVNEDDGNIYNVVRFSSVGGVVADYTQEFRYFLLPCADVVTGYVHTDTVARDSEGIYGLFDGVQDVFVGVNNRQGDYENIGCRISGVGSDNSVYTSILGNASGAFGAGDAPLGGFGRLPWRKLVAATPSLAERRSVFLRHNLANISFEADIAAQFVRGVGGKDLRDGHNQRLWYTFSNNLSNVPAPLNPHSLLRLRTGWLELRNQDGDLLTDRAAAVVIAPGKVAGPGRVSEEIMDSVHTSTVRISLFGTISGVARGLDFAGNNLHQGYLQPGSYTGIEGGGLVITVNEELSGSDRGGNQFAYFTIEDLVEAGGEGYRQLTDKRVHKNLYDLLEGDFGRVFGAKDFLQVFLNRYGYLPDPASFSRASANNRDRFGGLPPMPVTLGGEDLVVQTGQIKVGAAPGVAIRFADFPPVYLVDYLLTDDPGVGAADPGAPDRLAPPYNHLLFNFETALNRQNLQSIPLSEAIDRDLQSGDHYPDALFGLNIDPGLLTVSRADVRSTGTGLTEVLINSSLPFGFVGPITVALAETSYGYIRGERLANFIDQSAADELQVEAVKVVLPKGTQFQLNTAAGFNPISVFFPANYRVVSQLQRALGMPPADQAVWLTGGDLQVSLAMLGGGLWAATPGDQGLLPVNSDESDLFGVLPPDIFVELGGSAVSNLPVQYDFYPRNEIAVYPFPPQGRPSRGGLDSELRACRGNAVCEERARRLFGVGESSLLPIPTPVFLLSNRIFQAPPGTRIVYPGGATIAIGRDFLVPKGSAIHFPPGAVLPVRWSDDAVLPTGRRMTDPGEGEIVLYNGGMAWVRDSHLPVRFPDGGDTAALRQFFDIELGGAEDARYNLLRGVTVRAGTRNSTPLETLRVILTVAVEQIPEGFVAENIANRIEQNLRDEQAPDYDFARIFFEGLIHYNQDYTHVYEFEGANRFDGFDRPPLQSHYLNRFILGDDDSERARSFYLPGTQLNVRLSMHFVNHGFRLDDEGLGNLSRLEGPMTEEERIGFSGDGDYFVLSGSATPNRGDQPQCQALFGGSEDLTNSDGGSFIGIGYTDHYNPVAGGSERGSDTGGANSLVCHTDADIVGAIPPIPPAVEVLVQDYTGGTAVAASVIYENIAARTVSRIPRPQVNMILQPFTGNIINGGAIKMSPDDRVTAAENGGRVVGRFLTRPRHIALTDRNDRLPGVEDGASEVWAGANKGTGVNAVINGARAAGVTGNGDSFTVVPSGGGVRRIDNFRLDEDSEFHSAGGFSYTFARGVRVVSARETVFVDNLRLSGANMFHSVYDNRLPGVYDSVIPGGLRLDDGASGGDILNLPLAAAILLPSQNILGDDPDIYNHIPGSVSDTEFGDSLNASRSPRTGLYADDELPASTPDRSDIIYNTGANQRRRNTSGNTSPVEENTCDNPPFASHTLRDNVPDPDGGNFLTGEEGYRASARSEHNSVFNVINTQLSPELRPFFPVPRDSRLLFPFSCFRAGFDLLGIGHPGTGNEGFGKRYEPVSKRIYFGMLPVVERRSPISGVIKNHFALFPETDMIYRPSGGDPQVIKRGSVVNLTDGEIWPPSGVQNLPRVAEDLQIVSSQDMHIHLPGGVTLRSDFLDYTIDASDPQDPQLTYLRPQHLYSRKVIWGRAGSNDSTVNTSSPSQRAIRVDAFRARAANPIVAFADNRSGNAGRPVRLLEYRRLGENNAEETVRSFTPTGEIPLPPGAVIVVPPGNALDFLGDNAAPAFCPPSETVTGGDGAQTPVYLMGRLDKVSVNIDDCLGADNIGIYNAEYANLPKDAVAIIPPGAVVAIEVLITTDVRSFGLAERGFEHSTRFSNIRYDNVAAGTNRFTLMIKGTTYFQGPGILQLGDSESGPAFVNHPRYLDRDNAPVVFLNAPAFLQQAKLSAGERADFNVRLPARARLDLFGRMQERVSPDFSALEIPGDRGNLLRDFPMTYVVAPDCRRNASLAQEPLHTGECGEREEGLVFHLPAGEDYTVERAFPLPTGGLLMRAGGQRIDAMHFPTPRHFYSFQHDEAAYRVTPGDPAVALFDGFSIQRDGRVQACGDFATLVDFSAALGGVPFDSASGCSSFGLDNVFVINNEDETLSPLRIYFSSSLAVATGAILEQDLGGLPYAEIRRGENLTLFSGGLVGDNYREAGGGFAIRSDQTPELFLGVNAQLADYTAGAEVFGLGAEIPSGDVADFVRLDYNNGAEIPVPPGGSSPIPLDGYVLITLVTPHPTVQAGANVSRYLSPSVAINLQVQSRAVDVDLFAGIRAERQAGEELLVLSTLQFQPPPPPPLPHPIFTVAIGTSFPMEPGYLWQGYLPAGKNLILETVTLSGHTNRAGETWPTKNRFIRVSPTVSELNFWGTGLERPEYLDGGVAENGVEAIQFYHSGAVGHNDFRITTGVTAVLSTVEYRVDNFTGSTATIIAPYEVARESIAVNGIATRSTLVVTRPASVYIWTPYDFVQEPVDYLYALDGVEESYEYNAGSAAEFAAVLEDRRNNPDSSRHLFPDFPVLWARHNVEAPTVPTVVLTRYLNPIYSIDTQAQGLRFGALDLRRDCGTVIERPGCPRDDDGNTITGEWNIGYLGASTTPRASNLNNILEAAVVVSPIRGEPPRSDVNFFQYLISNEQAVLNSFSPPLQPIGVGGLGGIAASWVELIGQPRRLAEENLPDLLQNRPENRYTFNGIFAGDTVARAVFLGYDNPLVADSGGFPSTSGTPSGARTLANLRRNLDLQIRSTLIQGQPGFAAFDGEIRFGHPNNRIFGNTRPSADGGFIIHPQIETPGNVRVERLALNAATGFVSPLGKNEFTVTVRIREASFPGRAFPDTSEAGQFAAAGERIVVNANNNFIVTTGIWRARARDGAASVPGLRWNFRSTPFSGASGPPEYNRSFNLQDDVWAVRDTGDSQFAYDANPAAGENGYIDGLMCRGQPITVAYNPPPIQLLAKDAARRRALPFDRRALIDENFWYDRGYEDTGHAATRAPSGVYPLDARVGELDGRHTRFQFLPQFAPVSERTPLLRHNIIPPALGVRLNDPALNTSPFGVDQGAESSWTPRPRNEPYPRYDEADAGSTIMNLRGFFPDTPNFHHFGAGGDSDINIPLYSDMVFYIDPAYNTDVLTQPMFSFGDDFRLTGPGAIVPPFAGKDFSDQGLDVATLTRLYAARSAFLNAVGNPLRQLPLHLVYSDNRTAFGSFLDNRCGGTDCPRIYSRHDWVNILGGILAFEYQELGVEASGDDSDEELENDVRLILPQPQATVRLVDDDAGGTRTTTIYAGSILYPGSNLVQPSTKLTIAYNLVLPQAGAVAAVDVSPVHYPHRVRFYRPDANLHSWDFGRAPIAAAVDTIQRTSGEIDPDQSARDYCVIEPIGFDSDNIVDFSRTIPLGAATVAVDYKWQVTLNEVVRFDSSLSRGLLANDSQARGLVHDYYSGVGVYQGHSPHFSLDQSDSVDVVIVETPAGVPVTTTVTRSLTQGLANNDIPFGNPSALHWRVAGQILQAGARRQNANAPLLADGATGDVSAPLFTPLRLAHRITLPGEISVPVNEFQTEMPFPGDASGREFIFPPGSAAEMLHTDARNFESIHPFAARYLRGLEVGTPSCGPSGREGGVNCRRIVGDTDSDRQLAEGEAAGVTRMEVGGSSVMHHLRTEPIADDPARSDVPFYTNVWLRLPNGGVLQPLVQGEEDIILHPNTLLNPVLGTYILDDANQPPAAVDDGDIRRSTYGVRLTFPVPEEVTGREVDTDTGIESDVTRTADYLALIVNRPVMVVPAGSRVVMGAADQGRVVDVKGAIIFSLSPLERVACPVGGELFTGLYEDDPNAALLLDDREQTRLAAQLGRRGGITVMLNQREDGISDDQYETARGSGGVEFNLGIPCAWIDDPENNDGDRFFIYRGRDVLDGEGKLTGNDRTYLVGGRFEFRRQFFDDFDAPPMRVCPDGTVIEAIDECPTP